MLRTGAAHSARHIKRNWDINRNWAISSSFGRSFIQCPSREQNNGAIIDHVADNMRMAELAVKRINELIGQMSLAEKLGQLTMTAAGYAVTGPTVAGDSAEAIKAGTIGNLLNLVGADRVHELQHLAVEESRLGIPLLFAFDVVHGHRTLFPIPMAEAGLFDPETWTLTAREAAQEAAAEGIAMSFAPMLDVARDPRWGRSAEGPERTPGSARASPRRRCAASRARTWPRRKRSRRWPSIFAPMER